jgi:DNA-binding transcriptional LysR family regulator
MDMSWDDLRVFLAAERGGTISAAASDLGVSRSTVNRRLHGLEAASSVTLFERTPAGLVPTDAGLQLLPIARRMEEDALAAERVFAGRDATISGRIDVTQFEAAGEMLAPAFAEFQRVHPEIELHVTTSNRPLSLRRRESDLAIRGTDEPNPELVGVSLGRMEYAVYGRPEIVASDNPPWVLWDRTLGATGTWTVARRLGAPLRVAAEVDSQHLMNELVSAGAGLGLLPMALASRRAELVTMGPVPQPDMSMGIWALTHPDLRRSPRVRAVMRFLAEKAPALVG